MARLLVSVRSVAEASRAVEAGADIIDVKEPDFGSLGRADFSVWRQVRSALSPTVPLSVALGELNEWLETGQAHPPAGAWEGLSYRKMGLAGAGLGWCQAWRELRSRLGRGKDPPWIAVAYADWKAAAAPDPNAILATVSDSPEIVGILIDTWAKTEPFRPDAAWIAWARRVHQTGLMLAVAGGLNRQSIPALAPLAPDVVAVRGAACFGGARLAAIDPKRVAELTRAVGAFLCRSVAGDTS
ncbi:MAG: (5-formylfuran-3-yl)methyl phosphate synthase [Isosphaeraceae bacterium]